MNKNKNAIDIVVPVYNGYEDIQLPQAYGFGKTQGSSD